jgi:thiosulfate reductase cytochrome b subunit
MVFYAFCLGGFAGGTNIMVNRIYLLAPWIRIWHWTNALLMIILIISGTSLHFADPDAVLLPFALASDLHNIAGIALCVTYAVFVVANIISGNWWQYVPKPHEYLRRLWIQSRFYAFDIFLGKPHPFPPTKDENFNPLQQIVYWSVMYLLMPLLLITGLVFLFPEFAPERIMGVDGLLPIAIAHYIIGFFITLFMLGHIYMATLGPTPTTLLKMMITGWHEHEEHEELEENAKEGRKEVS